MARYLAELDRWRRRINLTGALSAQELALHALESTLGASLIAHGARVIDIGSGAGFPGLPLAIVRPDLSVTLVEPRQRRAAFLRHSVRELLLQNTTVFQGRIEEVGGQTFDTATTRAVGGLPRWIGDAAFLKPAGTLLAWTTEPEKLEIGLAPLFSLETAVAIPGSALRKIAAYRKQA
jgi:16S rRNA (guanine527-N7)-methyltransferase